MNQGQDKPKTLLIFKRADESTAPERAEAWARLGKALKTFTDFSILEISETDSIDPLKYLEGQDHLFLDSSLADWKSLAAKTVKSLTLVALEPLAWSDPEIRSRCLEVFVRHSGLVLEGLSASDLVRVLHLFLLPKRMAGVAPVMEKGSLIVGEKVMDGRNVGSLLDRLAAFFEGVDGLELKARIPDLRQVLSALVLEGLRLAGATNVLYPYVDFQASASKKKLGVNIRVPRGSLRLEQLLRDALSGADLFWHQIWQCSDVTVITEHHQHDELEVMLVFTRPTRGSRPSFGTMLFKSLEKSAARENLLEAPETYHFRQLAEIRPRESESLFIAHGDKTEEIDLASLPENVARHLSELEEKCGTFSENLLRKDSQLQEAIRKSQTLTAELNQKRGESLRLLKTLETQSEASERKIRDLEEKIVHLKSMAMEDASAKATHIAPSTHEAMARLEALLRAAESEKSALRENVAHEQKRVSLYEQKYSALYKESTTKDREINELRSTFAKLRKEQVKHNSPSQPETVIPSPDKVKETETRDLAQKQEIRKLSFKLDNQEKYAKAQQAEASEKLQMLEQKLKEAKAKELELHKKVDELSAALKRIQKAA